MRFYVVAWYTVSIEGLINLIMSGRIYGDFCVVSVCHSLIVGFAYRATV